MVLHFHKTADLYEVGLLLDEIMVIFSLLWQVFYVPITEEMVQIVRHYDVIPI